MTKEDREKNEKKGVTILKYVWNEYRKYFGEWNFLKHCILPLISFRMR